MTMMINDIQARLTRAAVEGMIAGLALISAASATAACSSKQSTTVVAAPMESAETPSSSSTAAKPPPIAALPIVIGEEVAKDCCKGKNECKGKSGCMSARNECKGMNECKGWGTSCDESDDDPRGGRSGTRSGVIGGNKPRVPRATPFPTGNANCCNGKNQCKGQSACRTASNPKGAGWNDCKGKGTSCPSP